MVPYELMSLFSQISLEVVAVNNYKGTVFPPRYVSKAE